MSNESEFKVQSHPNRPSSQRGWKLTYLVRDYPLLVLGAIILIGAGVAVMRLTRLNNHLIESVALDNVKTYSSMLTEIRSLYTSEVVANAREAGIKVTHDYDDHPHAIPLPATLTLLLGKRINEKAGSIHTAIYSPYPFPWRVQEGGLKDQFATDAWKMLQQYPKRPYYKIEKVGDRLFMRYAIADVMQSQCVDCHNSHPESPKRDWKVGQLRGVLQIDYPLDQAVEQAGDNLHQLFWLVGVVGLFAVTTVGLAIAGLRRTTIEVQDANEQLIETNDRIEAQRQELDCQNIELTATQLRAELTNDILKRQAQELESARVAALNMMQDMQIARQQAEIAARSKGKFLANMSHEIRTPMTAILGYADLMTNPSQSSDERENCIQTIRRNGKHLLTIINDILDLSKIDAGMMTVERISISPGPIVAEILSLMRPRALEQRLQLNARYTSAIPLTIHSDPTRLRQILLNLIGNALKFTKSGSVTLDISLSNPDGDEPAKLVFKVIDTGIGMTPVQREQLFEAFSQADNSVTRKFGGTGLGLTISKRLSQMLGGDISVTSELGQGSTFVVEIETGPLVGPMTYECPDEAMIEPVESTNPTTLKPGSRILLAEDGLDNQRLISFILKKADAEVTVVENGQLAFDAAIAADKANQPYDVILMDMQMPVLDGYNATRQLRQQGYCRPIIALTAHAMRGDRDKCIDAGCDDYTTKPINKVALLTMIQKHIDRFASTDTGRRTPTTDPAGP